MPQVCTGMELEQSFMPLGGEHRPHALCRSGDHPAAVTPLKSLVDTLPVSETSKMECDPQAKQLLLEHEATQGLVPEGTQEERGGEQRGLPATQCADEDLVLDQCCSPPRTSSSQPRRTSMTDAYQPPVRDDQGHGTIETEAVNHDSDDQRGNKSASTCPPDKMPMQPTASERAAQAEQGGTSCANVELPDTSCEELSCSPCPVGTSTRPQPQCAGPDATGLAPKSGPLAAVCKSRPLENKPAADELGQDRANGASSTTAQPVPVSTQLALDAKHGPSMELQQTQADSALPTQLDEQHQSLKVDDMICALSIPAPGMTLLDTPMREHEALHQTVSLGAPCRAVEADRAASEHRLVQSMVQQHVRVTIAENSEYSEGLQDAGRLGNQLVLRMEALHGNGMDHVGLDSASLSELVVPTCHQASAKGTPQRENARPFVDADEDEAPALPGTQAEAMAGQNVQPEACPPSQGHALPRNDEDSIEQLQGPASATHICQPQESLGPRASPAIDDPVHVSGHRPDQTRINETGLLTDECAGNTAANSTSRTKEQATQPPQQASPGAVESSGKSQLRPPYCSMDDIDILESPLVQPMLEDKMWPAQRTKSPARIAPPKLQTTVDAPSAEPRCETGLEIALGAPDPSGKAQEPVHDYLQEATAVTNEATSNTPLLFQANSNHKTRPTSKPQTMTEARPHECAVNEMGSAPCKRPLQPCETPAVVSSARQVPCARSLEQEGNSAIGFPIDSTNLFKRRRCCS